MNYLRKYRNRFICKIELVSALKDAVFPISPPDGFTGEEFQGKYNGVYFTLSSANLGQKTKTTNAGPLYVITLEFSFPNFPNADEFQLEFARLAEIRLTLNTGAVIRLNKNDISLNRPMDVEFQTSLKTLQFSTSLTQIVPFSLENEL